MHSITLALTLALVATVAVADDAMMKYEQISVEIMQKSGMMTLMATEMEKEDDDDDSSEDDTTAEPAATTTTTAAPTTTEAAAGGSRKRRDTDAQTNIVNVMFKSLMEINLEGNEIGNSKTPLQNRPDFSDVTFTMGEQKADSTIPNSQNADSGAIKATEQSYHTALGGDGLLKVFVYIAQQDGNVTNGDEVMPIKKGQVKFSVHIEGWVWCTEEFANCMNGEIKEVADGLKMVIEVKGKGEAVKQDTASGMAMHFAIGNDNHLFVSKKMHMTSNADAMETMDMNEGYPMTGQVEGDDDTTALTLRFPLFEKSLLYDPSIRLMVPGSDETAGASAVVASAVLMMVALFAALF